MHYFCMVNKTSQSMMAIPIANFTIGKDFFTFEKALALAILARLISRPPEVSSLMMDQVDLTLVELNPVWFTSILP